YSGCSRNGRGEESGHPRAGCGHRGSAVPETTRVAQRHCSNRNIPGFAGQRHDYRADDKCRWWLGDALVPAREGVVTRRRVQFLAVSICIVSQVIGANRPGLPPSTFEPVTRHVRIYRDVVNVGVIEKDRKALLIDSGEGSILQAVKTAGITQIDWALYTHHHRDQCSGAELLKKAGVKIAVPAG